MVRAVRVMFFSPSLNLLTDLRIPQHGTGAVYALASLFAFAAPNARFLLFFVVPMPAWACIGAVACFDVYNAVTRRVRLLLLSRNFLYILHTITKTPFMQFPTLDSAGHVGGLTAGALYWIMRTRFRLF